MVEKLKAPPLIPLEAIDLGLVAIARRIRREEHVIPESVAALEFVRYLRTTGAFDNKEPKNLVNRNYIPGDV